MSESGKGQTGFIMKMALVGAIIIAAILIVGAWWVGQSAKKATDDAVRSISMFYLDELTGRREQVVEANLAGNIESMRTAVSLMTEDDLADVESLQAYQARMKRLYNLEKFAFVDENGRITGLF